MCQISVVANGVATLHMSLLAEALRPAAELYAHKRAYAFFACQLATNLCNRTSSKCQIEFDWF